MLTAVDINLNGFYCVKRKFYRRDNRVFRYFRRLKRGEKRFYWCKFCQCYHLTSKGKG